MKIASILFIATLLSSCSTFYVPSSPVYFNNDDKGDFMFATNLGASNANVLAGYALTNNLNVGLMASRKNGGTATVTTANSTTVYEGIKGFEPQVILGFDRRITSSHKIEINIGGGPTIITQPNELKNLSSYFLQPSLLWTNPQKKLNTFVSLRGNYVMRTEEFGQSDSTIADLFIEPTVQLNFGKDVKFNLTFGYSHALGTGLNEAYSPFMLSIGARYNLRKGLD